MSSPIDCRLIEPLEDSGSQLNEKKTRQTHKKRLPGFKKWDTNLSSYLCDHCSVNFASKQGLLCHMEIILGYGRAVTVQGKENNSSVDGLCMRDHSFSSITDEAQLTTGQTTGSETIPSDNSGKKMMGEKNDIDLMIAECKDVCPFCGQQENNLKDHVTENHYGKLMETVSVVTADVTDSGCSWNVSDVKFKSSVCLACCESFSDELQLKQHMCRNRDLRPDASYVCDFCQAIVDEQKLNIHFKVHHSTLPYLKPTVRLSKKRRGDTLQFNCDICNKVFTTKKSLRDHIYDHGFGTFKCNLCKIPFKTKLTLRRHSAVHTALKAFMCDTCGKKFGWKHNLTNHMKTHSDARPHVCDLCTKAFKVMSHLQLHKKGVHGIMPNRSSATYVCQMCNAAYTSRQRLELHSRTHTGFKPFSCNACHREFTSSAGLQVHLSSKSDCLTRKSPNHRYRSKYADERRFQCQSCGRAFKKRAHLNQHMDWHMDIRPFPCTFCPKQFRRAEQLTLHTRTHTGEKPYVCQTCGRGFAQSGDCKKHERIHERRK